MVCGVFTAGLRPINMSYCIMSCRNANLPTVGLELFGGGGE